MRRKIINTIAALAVLAGLIIGAVGSGLLAFMAAFAIAYVGALILIAVNTRWIWTR